MKRLSSNQIKYKIKLATSISEFAKPISVCLEKEKDNGNKTGSSIKELFAKVNELVEEANIFMKTIHEAQEDYMGERSERWHDGASGEAYQEWSDAWSQEFAGLDEEVTLPEVQKFCQNIDDALMELPDCP